MTDVPDDPDRECSDCQNRNWNQYLSRQPTHYSDNSEVMKHYYTCTECGNDGFIYEENGVLTYTGNLR